MMNIDIVIHSVKEWNIYRSKVG